MEQAIRELQAVIQKLIEKVENRSHGPGKPGLYAAIAGQGLPLDMYIAEPQCEACDLTEASPNALRT